MLSALLAALATAAAAQADDSQCGGMPCRSNGTPYVTDKGAIVIYPGEHFVIAFKIEDGKITGVEPIPGGSLSNAVEVSFSQIDSGMMLSVANHLPKTVKYDATMTRA